MWSKSGWLPDSRGLQRYNQNNKKKKKRTDTVKVFLAPLWTTFSLSAWPASLCIYVWKPEAASFCRDRRLLVHYSWGMTSEPRPHTESGCWGHTKSQLCCFNADTNVKSRPVSPQNTRKSWLNSQQMALLPTYYWPSFSFPIVDDNRAVFRKFLIGWPDGVHLSSRQQKSKTFVSYGFLVNVMLSVPAFTWANNK